MFIAFVLGAAWSGMTAFVPPAALTEAHDAVIGKYLRRLAVGRMSWQLESGETRCYPDSTSVQRMGDRKECHSPQDQAIKVAQKLGVVPPRACT
eukprot:7694174-Pyramimonas_sp.AAC.1